MRTTEQHLREIIHLSLTSSPENMLEKALHACIDIAGARGGSILGEEGPHLQFLFSNLTELVGVRVPLDSIAGITVGKNVIIYTYAPKDKRHFKGVDQKTSRITEYLLSIPISSIHSSAGEGRIRNAGALQLLFDRNIIPGLEVADGPHEFDIATFRETYVCKNYLKDIFWLLPNIALGLEVMRLRQTSYQVIHELKNKMISALSWFNYLKDDIKNLSAEVFTDEAIQEDMDLAISSISEGEALAKTYLQFTKVYTPCFEKTNINTVLEETAASAEVFAREQMAGEFSINLRLNPDLPEKFLDPQQLKMAFFNLCKNAVEALVEHEVDRPTIDISSSLKDNSLVIVIADNGPGMPREIADSLFIPFKTKKEGGTGLGLAITKKIIDVHGGQIRCETGDSGTRFTITL